MPRGQLWQVARDHALLDTVEDPTRGWEWINAGNRPPALVGRTNDALHKRFTRLTAAQRRAARAYVPPVPFLGAPSTNVAMTGQPTAAAPAILVPTTTTGSSAQHPIAPAVNAPADPVDDKNAAEDDEPAAESKDEGTDDETTEATQPRGRKRIKRARSEEVNRDSSASDTRNVRRKLGVRGVPTHTGDDDAEEAVT